MTNEEKDLLIAYLVDAGDIDPDDDVEASSWRGTRSVTRWCWAKPTTWPSWRPPRYGIGLASRTWDCLFSTRHGGLLPNALAEGWLVDHQVERADRQRYCKRPPEVPLAERGEEF